jgi:hypothetical protein
MKEIRSSTLAPAAFTYLEISLEIISVEAESTPRP